MPRKGIGLTLRQTIFVKEYLIDQNATRAAITAGYSKKSAATQGHDNLKIPEIAAEIKKGFAAKLKRTRKRAENQEFTKERWLQEVRTVALANMDDFATVEEIFTSNGRRGKRSGYTGVRAVLSKDRAPRLGRAIKKLSETKNGISIELHSKQAALDTLGKHYGWLKEQIDFRTPDGVQVILTMPSNGREAPKEVKEAPELPVTESDESKRDDGSS